MKILQAFLAGVISLMALGVRAAPLEICFDEANPPYMYAQSGAVAGIYPTLIEAAFRHIDTPVTLLAVPWARAIYEIDRGLKGVGGIYKNAEREIKYDFSQELYVETIRIYFNKEAPIAFAKVGDLDGLRIGVIRGWSYGDAFDAAKKAGRFTVEEVGSDEQNFRKLSAGRLDAVVAVAESGAEVLERFRLIGVAKTAVAHIPTYLAFPKIAKRTDTLKKFDQAIKTLKASGEYSRIVGAAQRQ